ncbi:MAG: hypothetical protein RL671_170 [Pseudomonadota bacterium]
MSWQAGLILVLIVAIGVPWLVSEITSAPELDEDWDEVAERKRQIERRAKIQSGEFR